MTIEEITARLRSRDCAMEWEIAAADTIDALVKANDSYHDSYIEVHNQSIGLREENAKLREELEALKPKPSAKDLAVAARAHEPTFECGKCHVVSYSAAPWCGNPECPCRAVALGKEDER